jgi:sporulation protein YabP
MEEKKHSLTLTERKKLSLTGILEVESFREDGLELQTDLGFLQITGTDLHVEKLDLERGEVIVSGEVISLYYPEEQREKTKGILRRLFS